MTTKQALDYHPTGKRKEDKPTKTWKRSIVQEIKDRNLSWNEVKGRGKALKIEITMEEAVEALCPKLSKCYLSKSVILRNILIETLYFQ